MSSPSQRRQRDSQSATPRRSNRQQSEANTPRNNNRQSQLASRPLFYQSSSPAPGRDDRQDAANGEVSSPLRQMTNSQSTRGGGAPSSPLRQMTETQTDDDPQRTPRATPGLGGKVLLYDKEVEETDRSSLIAYSLRELKSWPVATTSI